MGSFFAVTLVEADANHSAGEAGAALAGAALAGLGVGGEHGEAAAAADDLVHDAERVSGGHIRVGCARVTIGAESILRSAGSRWDSCQRSTKFTSGGGAAAARALHVEQPAGGGRRHRRCRAWQPSLHHHCPNFHPPHVAAAARGRALGPAIVAHSSEFYKTCTLAAVKLLF